MINNNQNQNHQTFPQQTVTHQTTSNNITGDWAMFSATALFEGGQAFLKTISSANPTSDEAQLEADVQHVQQRLTQALATAKRARPNPGPHLLSAVRNWSRLQALAILREKAAGKATRPDFYQPFLFDLQQEIATMTQKLQQFWQQEDEQRAAAARKQAAAKREEAEQAFGAAYPYIDGLNDAVLEGNRLRQSVFESGQQVAQKWADKYENSVQAREKHLEEREKRIENQEKENREHQLALRQLSKWDDRTSFANTIVSTGRNAIGCLLIWFLLVVGIVLAIAFAFPHH